MNKCCLIVHVNSSPFNRGTTENLEAHASDRKRATYCHIMDVTVPVLNYPLTNVLQEHAESTTATEGNFDLQMKVLANLANHVR